MTQCLLVPLLTAVYCLLNAGLLIAFWRLRPTALSPAIFFINLFKTIVSLVTVTLSVFLIRFIACRSASLMHCIYCFCPTSSIHSLSDISFPATILFLTFVIFVQLIIIPIPQRLSRLLFVITVIASNIISALLTAGLLAMLK